MNDKNKTSTRSRNMKLKARIPQGVIALICTLPALHKGTHEIYDILMEIVEFGNDVVLRDTKANEYYNSETQSFDVTSIFGNWAKPNPDDPSHKIAKDVCLIIEKQMFE